MTSMQGNTYDTTNLTKILVASLTVFGLVVLGNIYAEWQQWSLLNAMNAGEHFDEEVLLQSDQRVGLWALAYLLSFFVTAFLFCRWTLIAKKKAAAFTRRKFEISPGWSVGWFFIPIAWLWKPYQAIKETFHASAPNALTQNKSFERPGILPIWWSLWLASSILGSIGGRFGFRAESLGEMIAATTISLTSNVLEIPLTIAAITMVRLLHQWQSQKQPLQSEPPAADLTIGSVM